MADLGPVLIPALAAVGGAGLTATAGYLSSRERYSQRIERLAKVRDSVADNSLLRVRLELMIHHEISLASTYKSTAHFFNAAIAVTLWGYLGVFISMLMRAETDEPAVFDVGYLTIYWVAFAIMCIGSTALVFSIVYRRRITVETLPRPISGEEIANLVKEENRMLEEYGSSPPKE